jgi:hypothetical protein
MGNVPVVLSITIGLNSTISLVLPFGVSRWWDILLAPIFIPFIILALRWEGKQNRAKSDSPKERRRKEESELCIMADFIIAIMFGISISLMYGQNNGISISIGLIFPLISALVRGLSGGLISALTMGLAIGLAYGLPAGVMAGIAFTLTASLAGGLRSFSVSTYQHGPEWLAGK